MPSSAGRSTVSEGILQPGLHGLLWPGLTMGPRPVAQPGSACSSRLQRTSNRASWVCSQAQHSVLQLTGGSVQPSLLLPQPMQEARVSDGARPLTLITLDGAAVEPTRDARLLLLY